MDSKTRWFDDILRAAGRREQALADSLRRTAVAVRAHSAGEADPVTGYLSERAVDELLSLFRHQMMVLCDSLMAAFDGATALSDAGVVLEISDNQGSAFGHNLQREFMDYLVDRGLQ